MLGRSRLKAGQQSTPRQSLIPPHHVKVSLTISATTALKKRVALKWALAHSAHVVLCEEEEEEGQRENSDEDMYREKRR